MSQCSWREPTVERDRKGLGKEQHQKRYLLQTFYNLGMRGRSKYWVTNSLTVGIGLVHLYYLRISPVAVVYEELCAWASEWIGERVKHNTPSRNCSLPSKELPPFSLLFLSNERNSQDKCVLVTRLFFNLGEEWAEGLTSLSNSRSALLPLTHRQFSPIKWTGTSVLQYHVV